MKGLLGILAVFIGIPLVCFGLYGLVVGVALSGSEPEFSDGMAGYGMMALLFGGLLCWAAWKNTREENICPNCHCWLADGSRTCKCCGADLK